MVENTYLVFVSRFRNIFVKVYFLSPSKGSFFFNIPKLSRKGTPKCSKMGKFEILTLEKSEKKNYERIS